MYKLFVYLVLLIFGDKSKFSVKLYYLYLKFSVKNKNFTIISNNCWGGGIYEDLKLPYNTPTVGLFFHAPCYILFLSDLKQYIEAEIIHFVKESKYPQANEFRKKNKWYYPIGILGDIEIHFMHYGSEKECIEKWNRRKKRINWDNLFFKMCDRDLCTKELRDKFLSLEYRHKVFFGSEKANKTQYIFLESYEKMEYVGSLYEEPWKYRKHFNVSKWINA
jgi:uncharacterized protein (DUF1919 family)